MRAKEFANTKLVIFDIDDTLVNTDTKVGVVRDSQVIKKLNSHDFTHYKLQPGETFDFGDFANAKEFFHNARPIVPMIQQLRQDIATGNKVIMVTARADFDNREVFLDTFRKYGVDIDRVHVYRAGNIGLKVPTEEKKKMIIRRVMGQDHYDKVIMYDDAEPNLHAFLSLAPEYPWSKFYAWHVDRDGTATEYHRSNIKEDPAGEADRIMLAALDFYKNRVGDVAAEPVENYKQQASELLKKSSPGVRDQVLTTLKKANANPYIQGGVITTVGAVLAGGLLASAQKMGLNPTQTNMLLQAVLNTVIPTMVSRVNGKSWRDTIKYTLASAGIGTGIAALTEDNEPGAAGCIIVAEDTGRWCFQQRSDSVSDPGVWAAWGGGREPGESIEQTVRRELAEEGGYCGPIKLEHLHTSPQYITFIGRVPHEFEPRLNFESKDYCWVNPGEWPEPLHPGVAKSLKKQSVSESRIEVVDVESIHNESLRKHLLANPELYENTEDFKSIRNFLNTHKTPVPTPGKKYVYASVQSTPMARYISIAHFNNNHKLIKLDGNYAYFDVDGKIKQFPESGTLSGDSLSQIYFFNSLSDFEKFDLLLKLKFSDHKKISKVLDRDDVSENFADGKVRGKSRPGRVKRSGASCKGSVTDLRAKAKKYGGERGRMYHWCANMKSGRNKKS